jgi:hypothetical protein
MEEPTTGEATPTKVGAPCPVPAEAIVELTEETSMSASPLKVTPFNHMLGLLTWRETMHQA